MPQIQLRLTLTVALLLSVAVNPSRAQEVDTPPTQNKATPLHIALVVPLSGDARGAGSDLQLGSNLAVNQTRAEFAKLGFEVSLKTFDDKMSPAVAKGAARAILADSSTLVTVGALESEVTLMLAQQFRDDSLSKTRADTLSLIVPSPVDIALTGPEYSNVIRIIARNDGMARVAGQYLQKALKAGRVLLIHDNSDDGSDANTSIANYLKLAHIPVVGQLSTFQKGEQVDLTNTLADVKRLKPDAIALSLANPVSSAQWVTALRAAGIKVPIMGTVAFSDPAFVKLAAQDAVGVYYASFNAPIADSSTAPPTSPGQTNPAVPKPFLTNAYSAYASPSMPDFIRAYTAFVHRPPTASSVLGYDAMSVALEGLRSAIHIGGGKLPTRAEVARALHGVHLENALSGPLRFNRAGDLLESHAYVLRFDESLQAKLVSIVSVQGDPK